MSNHLSSNDENKQLRLIIPRSLLDDLTFLAKSRFISRLGLIRLYLSEKVQHELCSLTQQADQVQATTRAKNKIQERLDLLEETKASKTKRRWED